MTLEDRTAVAQALWDALARLVTAKYRVRELSSLHTAIEALYNDNSDVRAAAAYREGQQAAAATLDAARDEAFRAGMLAVKKRSDFRDLDDIGDPEELRSTH